MFRHLPAPAHGPSPQAQHQLKLPQWEAEAVGAVGKERVSGQIESLVVAAVEELLPLELIRLPI